MASDGCRDAKTCGLDPCLSLVLWRDVHALRGGHVTFLKRAKVLRSLAELHGAVIIRCAQAFVSFE